LPYAVKDGYSGLLVPSGNPEELAGAIRSLLDQPELRSRLGQQAIIHAEQFGWRSIADRVIDLYRDLTGAPIVEPLPIPARGSSSWG
jgi:D-inositol-3-phosphate glycosyltransferase